MKKRFWFVLALILSCFMFMSFSPSLDGRAVVANEGDLPQGIFAKTVGYLPGDSISVTNLVDKTTVDILVIGALDPSEGVAILLTPEAAKLLGISKDSNNVVKITKRTGQLDEVVSGTALIANSSKNETEENDALKDELPPPAQTEIEKSVAISEPFIEKNENSVIEKSDSENSAGNLAEKKEEIVIPPAFVENEDKTEETETVQEKIAVDEPLSTPIAKDETESVQVEEKLEPLEVLPEKVEESKEEIKEDAKIEEKIVEEVENPTEEKIVEDNEKSAEETHLVEENFGAEEPKTESVDFEKIVEEEKNPDEPEKITNEMDYENTHIDVVKTEKVDEELPLPQTIIKSERITADGELYDQKPASIAESGEEPVLPEPEDEEDSKKVTYEEPVAAEKVSPDNMNQVYLQGPEKNVSAAPYSEEELPKNYDQYLENLEREYDEEYADDYHSPYENPENSKSVTDGPTTEVRKPEQVFDDLESEPAKVEEKVEKTETVAEEPKVEEAEEPVVEENTENTENTENVAEVSGEKSESVVEEKSEEKTEEDSESYEAIVLVPAENNPPEETKESETKEAEEKTEENAEENIIKEEMVEADIIAPIPIEKNESKVEEKAVVEVEKEEKPAETEVKVEVKKEEPKKETKKTETKKQKIDFSKYTVDSLKDLQSGKYYIQIAVLSDENNIKTIFDKYFGKYPIVLVPLKSGAAKQVLIGPLSVDEYGTVLQRFKSYGYKDCFLRKIK